MENENSLMENLYQKILPEYYEKKLYSEPTDNESNEIKEIIDNRDISDGLDREAVKEYNRRDISDSFGVLYLMGTISIDNFNKSNGTKLLQFNDEKNKNKNDKNQLCKAGKTIHTHIRMKEHEDSYVKKGYIKKGELKLLMITHIHKYFLNDAEKTLFRIFKHQNFNYSLRGTKHHELLFFPKNKLINILVPFFRVHKIYSHLHSNAFKHMETISSCFSQLSLTVLKNDQNLKDQLLVATERYAKAELSLQSANIKCQKLELTNKRLEMELESLKKEYRKLKENIEFANNKYGSVVKQLNSETTKLVYGDIIDTKIFCLSKIFREYNLHLWYDYETNKLSKSNNIFLRNFTDLPLGTAYVYAHNYNNKVIVTKTSNTMYINVKWFKTNYNNINIPVNY